MINLQFIWMTTSGQGTEYKKSLNCNLTMPKAIL